jgi:hypothetical protein
VDNNYLDLGMSKSGFIHTLPSGRLTLSPGEAEVRAEPGRRADAAGVEDVARRALHPARLHHQAPDLSRRLRGAAVQGRGGNFLDQDDPVLLPLPAVPPPTLHVEPTLRRRGFPPQRHAAVVVTRVYSSAWKR